MRIPQSTHVVGIYSSSTDVTLETDDEGAVPTKCLGILDVDPRKTFSTPGTCGHFVSLKRKETVDI